MATEKCLLVDVLGPGQAINWGELRRHVEYPECGAVVSFEGVVRLTEDGRDLVGLDYEHHEVMARSELERLGRRTLDRFGVQRVACIHRIGPVPVGEASVAILVGADHRGPAFAACESLIAELKEVVPIWKAPVFAATGAGASEGGAVVGTGEVELRSPGVVREAEDAHA